ncbi:MAG: acylphosphatase [Deltaproteobacteria bacterium]|nr:acylphosphatase [Deltaproteobacteria bacterium]
MKRVHVIISGRVQGVFFRAYTEKTALSLNLKGWVRNLPDGRVEVLCEGKDTDVDTMLAWCREGPPSANVTGVEIGDEPYTGEFTGFSIRY